jgi:hypothetical protein
VVELDLDRSARCRQQADHPDHPDRDAEGGLSAGRARDVIGSPLALRERVRRAIQPANAKEIPGKPGGNE